MASRLTDAGATVGTVAYVSPEQLRGDPLDVRSDVFALGVVLYEMATGRPAFTGATTAVIAAAILHDDPPAPCVLRAALPAPLEAIILKTIEKDRSLRCQTAAELRADLKRFARASGESVAPASSAGDTRAASAPWPVRAPSRPRGSAWGRVALIVAPAVLIAAIVAVAMRSRGEEPTPVAALGRIRGLQPIGRESSFWFKGRSDDRRTIVETLGVQYILSGSVARAGDRLHVFASLSDADSGAAIRSRPYENRRSGDFFDIQVDIAAEVAEHLEVALGLGRGALPGFTQKVDAYDEFFRGVSLTGALDEGSLVRAAEHFRRALRLDPDFAVAHLLLRQVYLSHASIAPTRAMELQRAADAALDARCDSNPTRRARSWRWPTIARGGGSGSRPAASSSDSWPGALSRRRTVRRSTGASSSRPAARPMPLISCAARAKSIPCRRNGGCSSPKRTA